MDCMYRVKRSAGHGPAGDGWKMLTMALAAGRVGGEGASPGDGPALGNTIHKEGARGLWSWAISGPDHGRSSMTAVCIPDGEGCMQGHRGWFDQICHQD